MSDTDRFRKYRHKKNPPKRVFFGQQERLTRQA